MKYLKPVSLSFFLLLFTNSYSQSANENLKIEKKDNLQNLREEVLNTNSSQKKLSINTSVNSIAQSKKSPALALLFSVIIPGAGHYYINRMDVGKYFFGADVAFWLGWATLDVYGNAVNDDAVTYSVQHAKVSDPDGKNDDYFANVGNYNNIYEYNNQLLLQGQFGSLYDVNTYFWDWDNVNNRDIFESQRKSSERILNSRIVFGSLLIANRVVAGISAYLLTNKENKKSTSLNIEPEFLYKDDYSFDGVKINLSKNF
jgi:hypothetical protein